MAARVQFTTGFSRRYTGGVREFTVEAKNLRGVIKEMDRLYPGLGEHLEEETTVAIDGAIHETAYFQPIREGCEIFFIPNSKGDNGPRAGYPTNRKRIAPQISKACGGVMPGIYLADPSTLQEADHLECVRRMQRFE